MPALERRSDGCGGGWVGSAVYEVYSGANMLGALLVRLAGPKAKVFVLDPRLATAGGRGSSTKNPMVR